jgi:hypothetical protein
MLLNFFFIWCIVTAFVFLFWAFVDWVTPVEPGDLTVADFPFHVQLISNGLVAFALTAAGFLVSYLL